MLSQREGLDRRRAVLSEGSPMAFDKGLLPPLATAGPTAEAPSSKAGLESNPKGLEMSEVNVKAGETDVEDVGAKGSSDGEVRTESRSSDGIDSKATCVELLYW